MKIIATKCISIFYPQNKEYTSSVCAPVFSLVAIARAATLPELIHGLTQPILHGVPCTSISGQGTKSPHSIQCSHLP